jgi:phage/plasmid-associated DNA primase
MNAPIQEFLERGGVRVVEQGPDVVYTHNSMDPAGKYNIDRSISMEFWELYCKELYDYNVNAEKAQKEILELRNNNTVPEDFKKRRTSFLRRKALQFRSTLSEKPETTMPVLGDIDFRFEFGPNHPIKEPPESNIFTESHLKKVVSIYMRVLRSLDYSKSFISKDLDCFVLTKKRPYVCWNDEHTSGYFKNGFHIHFPFFHMKQSHQDQYVYKRVLEIAKEEHLFDNDPLILDDESEFALDPASLNRVFDTGVAGKHWLLYGSKKELKMESEPYLLHSIYRYENENNIQKIELTKCLEDRMVYKPNGQVLRFLPDNVNLDDISDPDEFMEACKEQEERMKFWLPLILSVRRYNLNDQTYIVKNQVQINQIKIKPRTQVNISDADKENSIAELERAAQILEFVKVERSIEYNSWTRIGWALYNISHGLQEGLDVFLQFSQRAGHHYDYASCVSHWENAEQSSAQRDAKLKLKCIIDYAKQDDPERFKEWESAKLREQFEDSRYNSQVEFAQFLYNRLKHKYICASERNNVWYEFQEHRWVRIDTGTEFYLAMIEELRPELKRNLQDLQRRKIDDPNNANLDANIAALSKLLNQKLGSKSFLDQIFGLCRKYFLVPQFEDKLDQNFYLTGFNNGVLDLTFQWNEEKQCKEMVGFRAGRPEDFVSKTTNIDFQLFDDSDPLLKEVRTFFVKVFPRPDVREYMYYYCGSILRGGNYNKTFSVFSGKGDNAKSVFVELLEKTLGTYMTKLPVTFLTQKRVGSSAATPETARLKGVKFVALEEPSENEMINSGTLKNYTGNDSTYERGLFSEPKEVKQSAKMALICNKLPNINSSDPALWIRVRRVLFESYFPKDLNLVPKRVEDQMRKKIFARDETLSERLPRYAPAFAYLMFLYYKRSLVRKIQDPQAVTDSTEEYRADNCTYIQFSRSELVRCGPENEIETEEMYNKYKAWFVDYYNTNKSMPNRATFMTDCTRALGIPMNGKFVGWREKTDTDLRNSETGARRTELSTEYVNQSLREIGLEVIEQEEDQPEGDEYTLNFNLLNLSGGDEPNDEEVDPLGSELIS